MNVEELEWTVMSVEDTIFVYVFSVAAMATCTIYSSGLCTWPVLQILLHEVCGVSNWSVDEGRQWQTGTSGCSPFSLIPSSQVQLLGRFYFLLWIMSFVCLFICMHGTVLYRLNWVERFMPCHAPVSPWVHGRLSGAFRNAVKPVEGMDTWPVSLNHATLTQEALCSR